MENVRVFNYNNKTFYYLEDIKKAEINSDFFVNCKTIRKCIEKHNIPEACCLYMKNDKVFDRRYRKADLFLLDEYVTNNIINADYQQKKEEQQKIKKEQHDKDRTELIKQRKKYDQNAIQDLPDLIDLEYHEKFKDDNDEPLEIEVRGEKTLEGALFKASDIGKAFQYDRIDKLVADKRGDYGYNDHYKYFNTEKGGGKSPSDHPNKELYLTYLGVMKVLFCARGNKAGRFQKWVSHILFAVQMGNRTDREKVAAEVLNVTHKKLLQCLNMSAGAISCVYLVKVGTVGNMRQHFKLQGFTNDEHIVYKFGKSCDLSRRLKEHFNHFGKLNNNKEDIDLVCYSYVDDDFISTTESRLKEYFQGFGIHVQDDNNKELIVMDEQRLNAVKQLYNDMYCQYSGKSKQIINQLKSLEERCKHLKEKYKAELRIKDSQMETKDQIIIARDAIIEARESTIREQEWEMKYLRKIDELRKKGIEC